MSRTHVVIDSSALYALLIDAGARGMWAAETVSDAGLSAPHLVHVEVTNILRRHRLAGIIDPSTAALAYRDLLDLPIELYGLEPVASRVWGLLANLTAYEASYVALAELLGCPLVTLDGRIAGAPGLGCEVLVGPP